MFSQPGSVLQIIFHVMIDLLFGLLPALIQGHYEMFYINTREKKKMCSKILYKDNLCVYQYRVFLLQIQGQHQR